MCIRDSNNSTLSGGLDRPSAAGEPTEVALVLAAANSGCLLYTSMTIPQISRVLAFFCR